MPLSTSRIRILGLLGTVAAGGGAAQYRQPGDTGSRWIESAECRRCGHLEMERSEAEGGWRFARGYEKHAGSRGWLLNAILAF